MDEKKKVLWKEEEASKEEWRARGCKGPLRMSRAAFYAIHPDYRSKRGDSTHPSCLAMGCGGGTNLVPVEFVKR